MRAYVMTTGVLFAAVTVAHLLRMIYESPDFASDPGYLGLTLLTTLMTAWAVVLVVRSGRTGSWPPSR